MKHASLKERYERLCQTYVEQFCAKQDRELEFWVSYRIGGTASFGSVYFLDFDDIRYDIDNEIEKGMIFQWIDHCVDNYEIGKNTWIDYHFYCNGLRISK